MRTTTCKAQDLGMLYFCADIFFSFRGWCVNSFELCCLVNSMYGILFKGCLMKKVYMHRLSRYGYMVKMIWLSMQLESRGNSFLNGKYIWWHAVVSFFVSFSMCVLLFYLIYRDPNLPGTLEVHDGTGDFLRKLELYMMILQQKP